MTELWAGCVGNRIVSLATETGISASRKLSQFQFNSISQDFNPALESGRTEIPADFETSTSRIGIACRAQEK